MNMLLATGVFQVMPALSDDDFASLKADIEERGVLVPVEYDEQGNVLDGHHRIRACQELGIHDWPKLIREGLSEDEKRVHARQLNLARRHLNQAQKRELISAQLHETPEKSDRQIAEGLGVSPTTVGNIRKEMEPTVQIGQLEKRVGKDGKTRSKPKKVKYVDNTPAGKAGAKERAKEVKTDEILAVLPPQQAETIKAEAEREGWSATEVRAAANRVKNEGKLPAASAPVEGRKVFDFEALVRNGEKFGTIYADPPWLYDNQGTRAATGNHYGGMTVEELCALPVKDIVAKDAHLHLWTTNGFLFECPKIFEAWGFEFRSSFVWVKPQMGIGNYWRNSHEFLLTAIRGDAKRFNDRSLMSWLQCERGVHSAKPEQVRHFIERASPGPFLEMFARSGAPNWTVWGNQIPGNLLDHGMAEVA